MFVISVKVPGSMLAVETYVSLDGSLSNDVSKRKLFPTKKEAKDYMKKHHPDMKFSVYPE